MDKILEFLKEIFYKVKDFLYQFFDKPINWYCDFLEDKLSLSISADKKAMYFWLTIAALSLIIILLFLIVNATAKIAKLKKDKKVNSEEAKVQDAIDVLEKKEELKETKVEETKVVENFEVTQHEKIIVEEIPPIAATTVDEAKPKIEPNPVAEEKNSKKELDMDNVEVKKEPAKKKTPTTTVKKETSSTPKATKPKTTTKKKSENSKPVVKKEIKPKATVKIEKNEDDDDLSTSEFLVAALQLASEEFERKQQSKKKAKEAPVIDYEIETKPVVEEKKVEEVKPEIKEEVIENKEPITEEVKVTPSIVVTTTKVEEYDENKHSAKIDIEDEDDEGAVVEPVVEETVVEETAVEEKKVQPKKKATPKKQTEKKQAPKIEIKGKYTISQEGDDFRYRLKASNGETLFTSEPYISENSTRSGINTLKKQLEIARIDIVEDKHGLFSFRLLTKQGRCLGTSANYPTKASATSAIDSFKRFSETDKIELEENHDHYEVEEFNEEVETVNNGKYKVIQKDNKFVYQLLASNGRIIATSNTYSSKDSCLEAFEKFRIIVYEGSFLIYKDKNSKYQFKLYNKQKRLILAGEVYDDKSRAISVIESIKKFAKKAKYTE